MSNYLDVYNKDGIVAEPAGAIAIAALNSMQEILNGKSVGVLVCGGNNDITRHGRNQRTRLVASKP